MKSLAPADQGLAPVMCIVGARPNFMKIAPILRALAAHEPPIPSLLVQTGQHYEMAISDQLRVPEYWDGAAAQRIAADLYSWLGAETGLAQHGGAAA